MLGMDAELEGGANLERRLPDVAKKALLASTTLLAAAGCSNDSDSDKPSAQELNALCQGMVDDALEEQEKNLNLTMLCKDMVDAAQGDPDLDMLCKDMVDAAKEELRPRTPEEKETESEQKEYTFAELTSLCDDRDGYIQVHGGCAYVNACAGFSFGDWGPDFATLTEHTCAGVNGCNGLSCVYTAVDQGRDPADLLKLEFPQPGPGACSNCHSGESDDEFKLLLPEGSTRNVDNWLDRPAEEQERVIAFGSQGVYEGGVAYAHMSAYKDVMSRAEIEALVAHIRTLTPVVKTIKTQD